MLLASASKFICIFAMNSYLYMQFPSISQVNHIKPFPEEENSHWYVQTAGPAAGQDQFDHRRGSGTKVLVGSSVQAGAAVQNR